MDPATCRDFPHPGSRLPLPACGSSGEQPSPGGGAGAGGWAVGGDFLAQSPVTPLTRPGGWHWDGWSWPALLAAHLLKTVLLSHHSWWNGNGREGRSPHCPASPGCGRALPGCTLCIWGEKLHRSP